MRHTINGQRREDQARRTIAVGTAAAVMPILAPAVTIWAGWSMHGIILATMLSTILAAGIVGMLLLRVTHRLAGQQRLFDEERRRWREEAQTDPLCRIANRRGAADAVESLQRNAGGDAAWSVLTLDVDRFKEVNDLHGHAVGDRVLTAVADVLTELLPDGAAVARWGGDEFVMFQLGPEGFDADFVARVTGEVAARAIPCREGDLNVDVSVGLAKGPSTASFEDVLAVADAALLDAKAMLHRSTRRSAGERRPGAADGTEVVTVARRGPVPISTTSLTPRAPVRIGPSAV